MNSNHGLQQANLADGVKEVSIVVREDGTKFLRTTIKRKIKKMKSTKSLKNGNEQRLQVLNSVVAPDSLSTLISSPHRAEDYDLGLTASDSSNDASFVQTNSLLCIDNNEGDDDLMDTSADSAASSSTIAYPAEPTLIAADISLRSATRSIKRPPPSIVRDSGHSLAASFDDADKIASDVIGIRSYTPPPTASPKINITTTSTLSHSKFHSLSFRIFEASRTASPPPPTTSGVVKSSSSSNLSILPSHIRRNRIVPSVQQLTPIVTPTSPLHVWSSAKLRQEENKFLGVSEQEQQDSFVSSHQSKKRPRTSSSQQTLNSDHQDEYPEDETTDRATRLSFSKSPFSQHEREFSAVHPSLPPVNNPSAVISGVSRFSSDQIRKMTSGMWTCDTRINQLWNTELSAAIEDNTAMIYYLCQIASFNHPASWWNTPSPLENCLLQILPKIAIEKNRLTSVNEPFCHEWRSLVSTHSSDVTRYDKDFSIMSSWLVDDIGWFYHLKNRQSSTASSSMNTTSIINHSEQRNEEIVAKLAKRKKTEDSYHFLASWVKTAALQPHRNDKRSIMSSNSITLFFLCSALMMHVHVLSPTSDLSQVALHHDADISKVTKLMSESSSTTIPLSFEKQKRIQRFVEKKKTQCKSVHDTYERILIFWLRLTTQCFGLDKFDMNGFSILNFQTGNDDDDDDEKHQEEVSNGGQEKRTSVDEGTPLGDVLQRPSTLLYLVCLTYRAIMSSECANLPRFQSRQFKNLKTATDDLFLHVSSNFNQYCSDVFSWISSIADYMSSMSSLSFSSKDIHSSSRYSPPNASIDPSNTQNVRKNHFKTVETFCHSWLCRFQSMLKDTSVQLATQRLRFFSSGQVP